MSKLGTSPRPHLDQNWEDARDQSEASLGSKWGPRLDWDQNSDQARARSQAQLGSTRASTMGSNSLSLYLSEWLELGLKSGSSREPAGARPLGGEVWAQLGILAGVSRIEQIYW